MVSDPLGRLERTEELFNAQSLGAWRLVCQQRIRADSFLKWQDDLYFSTLDRGARCASKSLAGGEVECGRLMGVAYELF